MYIDIPLQNFISTISPLETIEGISTFKVSGITEKFDQLILKDHPHIIHSYRSVVIQNTRMTFSRAFVLNRIDREMTPTEFVEVIEFAKMWGAR